VVRILIGPVVYTKRASAGRAQNRELSPSLVNPGLENAGNVADIIVVIAGRKRGRAAKFGNRGTPATIKRGSLAPAILKPTLARARASRDFSHYRGLNPSRIRFIPGRILPCHAFPGAVELDCRAKAKTFRTFRR